jgi:hypothetical protein
MKKKNHLREHLERRPIRTASKLINDGQMVYVNGRRDISSHARFVPVKTQQEEFVRVDHGCAKKKKNDAEKQVYTGKGS